MDVTVRRIPAQRVAAMRYEGALDKVGATFERLQAWARTQGIPDRPITGVFTEAKQPLNEFGAPHGASEGTAEAWVPAPDDLGGDKEAGVTVQETAPTKAAVATFEGNPEDILRFTDALRRFLRREGLGVTNETRMVYKDADWNDITHWTIEVQVPVVDVDATS